MRLTSDSNVNLTAALREVGLDEYDHRHVSFGYSRTSWAEAFDGQNVNSLLRFVKERSDQLRGKLGLPTQADKLDVLHSRITSAYGVRRNILRALSQKAREPMLMILEKPADAMPPVLYPPTWAHELCAVSYAEHLRDGEYQEAVKTIVPCVANEGERFKPTRPRICVLLQELGEETVAASFE